jgi:hypothetical protein
LVFHCVISIGISNHFFILAYLSNYSHIFFPYFAIFFSSLPYEHATKGFVFYKNKKKKNDIRWMEIILVYYYKLEMCLVVWMPYKLVCEILANMLLKHLIWYNSLTHLTIYSLIVIQLLLWYFLIGILILIYNVY